MAVARKHQETRLVVPKISSVERTSEGPVVSFQGQDGKKISLPATPVSSIGEQTQKRIIAALAAVS